MHIKGKLKLETTDVDKRETIRKAHRRMIRETSCSPDKRVRLGVGLCGLKKRKKEKIVKEDVMT